jgi:hypothetical protein
MSAVVADMRHNHTSRMRTALASAVILACAASPAAAIAHKSKQHRKHHARARVSHVVNYSSTTTGNLVWNGDLSTGTFSQYGMVQACTGPSPVQGASVVRNPVRPGYQYSAALTVSDQSITANCPQLGSYGHPNANILSPGLFTPGDDDYIGFSTMFPTSFPSNVCTPYVSGCWMQIFEYYGPPYGGSAPVALDVWGNHLEMWSHYGTIWRAPTNFVKGTWQDFVVHVHASTSASTGFVELWYNGVPQKFSNGQTRYYEATLQSGVNWNGRSANRVFLDQYRGANPALGTVTLYDTAAKVGTTYASAAP